MDTESIITSTTQFQTLLIAFVLIVAVIYFFIEIRRLDMKVTLLETNLKKMVNSRAQDTTSLPSEQDPIMNEINNLNTNHSPNIIQTGGESAMENPMEKDMSDPQTPTDNEEIIQTTHNIIETEEVNSSKDNEVESKGNPLESVLSFSLGQTSIINSISEEIANATETMMTQPSEITIITGNEKPVAANIVEETTIEDITGTVGEDKPVVEDEPVAENDDDSITMERIDDITEQEVNDTISIDDPILESDNEQPLLTEITAYTEYQNHTIKELKDILTDMNLPTSGNKTKLIQRIVSNKNKISN